MKVFSVSQYPTTNFKGINIEKDVRRIQYEYKPAPKIFSPALNAYFEMLKVNWATHVDEFTHKVKRK